MALTAPQLLAIRSQYGQDLSQRREVFALTKPQLDAALSAIDTWLDANAAAFNTALPVAARNNLTALQKAELLYLVCKKRFG